VERLTHFDQQGKARMVDVGQKVDTLREAVARARVNMEGSTLAMIAAGTAAKGDVLGVARVAGIMAAKRTGDLIPMCHPLAITSATVDFLLDERQPAVHIEARVTTTGKTGVEMEALTAASVAALTIYDMVKAVDRAMVIDGLRLVSKRGGKSGDWVREGEDRWPVEALR